jgi:hypothetical protein
MKRYKSSQVCLAFMLLSLGVFIITGCGSNGQTGHWLGTGIGTETVTPPVTPPVTPGDVTRPRVVSTVPITTDPGPTLSVPTNTLITALFTEEMAQASIQAVGTVTVTCTPSCVSDTLAGTVSYAVGSRTMIFTPTPAGTLLEASKTYTVTISTAATDVAGNALAGNQSPLPAASSYVWSFSTAAAPIPPANITVASVFPINTAPAVCPSSSISATFTVPDPILRINPLTVTASTFIVTGPGVSGPVVAAAAIDGRTVDVTGLIATFKPAAPLTPGLYTARIVSGADGVTDTAIPGNQLAADYTWTFTVVPATGVCLSPIPLNSAEPFGAISCAAVSGSTMGPTGTTINGDLGTTLTSTSITNFVGGGSPATPGIVNGTIYASDLPNPGDLTSATAIADVYIAYLAAQIIGLTGDVVPISDLGAVAGFGPNPLTPGTYKAGAYQSGSSLAISTPMTLDAQGDANAVWIFYAPSSLTTSGLGSILLINNAQAKNVFWVVGSSATLSAPSFSGNVLAATAISVTTVGVTVDGRLLTSGPTCAAVTWDAHLHTVNVPAP